MQQADFEIFVDLDDTLAAFSKSFRQISGGLKPGDVPQKRMWEIVQAVPKFWENLDLMDDALHLWEMIKHHPKVTILTCPSLVDYARAKPGKLAWVAKHLGPVKVEFRHGDSKKDFAHPKSILIDDYGKNIRSWQRAGGVGIQHRDAASTIAELLKLKAV